MTCSRKQWSADNDESSCDTEDRTSTTGSARKQPFEDGKSTVRSSHFDGTRYAENLKHYLRKNGNKSTVERFDLQPFALQDDSKTCGDNDGRDVVIKQKTKQTPESRATGGNKCVREVGGYVRKILDSLARHADDGGMECSDARWLQTTLESVIRVLDDFRGPCCTRPPCSCLLGCSHCFTDHGPSAHRIQPSAAGRKSRGTTTRLSGAGGLDPPLPCKCQQQPQKTHRDQSANTTTTSTVRQPPTGVELEKLMRAAADFGCLFGYAVTTDAHHRDRGSKRC